MKLSILQSAIAVILWELIGGKSDCSIIHDASPLIFKIKCCNIKRYGLRCENSRVNSIDAFEVTYSDVYYDELFPILGLLTELTVLRMGSWRLRNKNIMLPPNIGNLFKLQELFVGLC